MYTEYNGKKINIIDNPGFDDFVGELITSLRVADVAVMVVSAQNAVEVGTEVGWRNARMAEKPVIFAINHLEHDNSNFQETINQIKGSFQGSFPVMQYPVNIGPGFNSFIDLVQMKLYKYPADGGTPEILDIPENEKEKAEEMQAEFIEDLAVSDEELMEKFFEDGALSEADIHKGLEAGIKSRDIFPVLLINAKHNMGVGRLLEYISNNCPAPSEMPPVKTTEGEDVIMDANGDTNLFVFKASIESHLGEVLYFKVYNGSIEEGADLVNTRNGNKERLTQLYTIYGQNREKINKLVAGDIGATVKLKSTKASETLVAQKTPAIKIAPIIYPEPKYRMAIEAVNQSDDEKMGMILNNLSKMDPTLVYEFSRELKQLILGGQGELHLTIIKWILEHEEGIKTEFVTPKIPYRETITKSAKANYRHKKQSGGSGQFGEVHLMIEPYKEGMTYSDEFPNRGEEIIELEWGGKLVMINSIVGGSIDARFLPAIMKGVMERMVEGPLTGSYARDIVFYVYDGKMHPVDSNEISFKLAGRHAFSEAFKKSKPQILEPIYNVEVLMPEEYMGDVMTDLQGRRAIIQGMDREGKYQKITAKVPLAEMNRYSTSLSSITSGRAMYSMSYAEYTNVPGDLQTELLKTYAASQEDE
jgi:elongation factor G